MRSLPLFCALATLGTPTFADAPQVPSDTPYIVLADNLDEPKGYGFCLDTAGRGQTDLLQVHSCKPAAKDDAGNATPNDTQFTYDADNMRVESVAFPGQCMQVLISPYTAVFGLLECSDHPNQRFVLSSEDGTLRMNKDTTMCVSLGSETLEAGPWSRREMALTPCDETRDDLKKWTFVPES